MSLPVNSGGSLPSSQPKIVSLPQTQRIIQDILDCVRQLKEEFTCNKSPITDDSQLLQRFCAKLEYLLQYEMKERFTLLGKRKDYWDYFCDCLASNKGANDGIKYVKTLGEHKSSLGKGRAFIRFALVHQRLADSIQQCIIHPKTGDWYNTASVWMQSKLSSAIIGNLYDLNDLHFDLSPRGYDLDNAWPSFARNMPGSGGWNVPLSRRSSMTSMDTLSIVSTDPSEVSRLQQELASAETARSVLADSVTSLEQERQRAEQSVWMTQGELNAMQEQMKAATAKFEELQLQYSSLKQSHEQLITEKAEQEQSLSQLSDDLSAEQQRLSREREELTQQEVRLAKRIEEERARFSTDAGALQRTLTEVTEARDKLAEKVTSLDNNLEQAKAWDLKKDQQISRLEQQLAGVEQRNSELTEELAKSLSTREHEAASQLDSAQKFHELLSKLKDVESENVGFQASIAELKRQCDVSEKSLEEEKAKAETLQSKLGEETERLLSTSSAVKMLTSELEQEKDCVLKLQADLKLAQEESRNREADLQAMQTTGANLTHFISKLTQTVFDSTGAKGKQSVDVSSCSEEEMANFLERCQNCVTERVCDLESQLHRLEKGESSLEVEKDLVQQSVDSILSCLPDKPDLKGVKLSQQMRELETRVLSLTTRLSDVTTDNSFLKEQLNLAQGEQSDKGKQLSHLEGRLSEMEKMIRESRALESSLHGQVINLEASLKRAEDQNGIVQLELDKALVVVSEKSANLKDVEGERADLEKRCKDLERQTEELKTEAKILTKEKDENLKQEEQLKEQLQQRESSLSASEQDLQDKTSQLSALQEKVKEGEETVERFLALMAAIQSDKDSSDTEHVDLQQQLAETSNKFRNVLEEKLQEQTEKEKAQGLLSELSGSVSELKQSLEKKDCEVKALQESLQTDAQKHSAETLELKNQLESAVAELDQTKELLAQASAGLAEVGSSREKAEAERDSAAQKLQETVVELREKEVSHTEELHSLKVQLEQFRTEKEELRKTASSSQEEVTKVLSEKQGLIGKLQGEKSNIEGELREVLSQKEALETERKQVQSTVEDLKEKSEQERKASSDTLKQTQSQLQSEIDSLKEQNSDLSTRLEKVQNDLDRKLEDAEKAKGQLENFRCETERLRSDSASEKSELEDCLEKLQSRFSELQTTMDGVLKEKDELAALQVTGQDEVTELKADLAAAADGYNFLLQSSQKVQEEKEAETEILKSQLADMEETTKNLSADLEALSAERDSLEKKVQKLESDERTLKEREVELERRLSEKSAEVDKLKDTETSLSSSVLSLEEGERSKREEMQKLEQSLLEKDNLYSTQVEALQQELSALQFQLSAEQLQHEESLRSMGDHASSAADMSSRLSEQEAVISDLEKELSSLQAGFERERTNQSNQLDELKALSKAREEECRMLAEKLQRTSDKLEESLSTSELFQKENNALRKSLDNDLEEREEEIRILRSDNQQLKKQLVKVIRDKAALWQQTDALAYDRKVKSEGRWLDSGSVAKCMGCQAEFSLFLRKHHCRLCGCVFCYNCSDNWVDSASSSRKARACGQCYSDLQNFDASIAKASLLPDDSGEDDSSCVGSDIASQQDSMADDRSQTSLQQTPSADNLLLAGDNHPPSSSPTEDIYNNGRISDSLQAPDASSTPLKTATTTTPATAAGPPGAVFSDVSMSDAESQDGTFQVITQEEVTKSIAAYDEGQGDPQSLIDVPNMSSSMLLSADDLARGEINTQNETWVKPGRSFAVPIAVETAFTVVSWEFTVHPKDIQFSITYHHSGDQPVSQAEVVVAPTRCSSVREPVQGELTAKQTGVYTLVFDNSYSRMTSKKIHYSLKYDR